MANGHLDSVLQHVRGLAVESGGRGFDRELLERFVDQGDETAFAALFQRHGPVILALCRRLLRDTHDAEDACQATFLVLARRAASIRQQDSLGSWLHGVAIRVASNLRRTRARYRGCERFPVDVPQRGGEQATWREVQTLLEEGLQRLPERLRAPLVLCCLEGKTRDEAAREIGCTLEALRGRLERGRKLLRQRLARRGVDLSAALLAALISRSGNAAPLPPSFAMLSRTSRPAVLAEAVFKDMANSRGHIAAVLLLAAGIALGVGLVQSQAKRPAANAPKDAPTTDTPRADFHGDPLPSDALARMGTLRWRHGGAVFFVGLTHKGKQLVTASQDGWFRVWDTDTGKELRRFGRPYQGRPGDGPPRGRSVFFDGVPAIVALSPDGRLLAAGDQTGVARVWQDDGIHVWDVDSGKQLWSTKREGAAAGLTFTPDGKTLVTWGWRGLRQWEAASGKPSTRLPPLAEAEVNRPQGAAPPFTFSPAGKLLAGVLLDRETAGQPPLRGRTEEDRVRGRFGKIISMVRVWEVKSGKVVRDIKGQLGEFGCLAFSPDGKRLVLPSPAEGSIRVWDLAAGKQGQLLQGRLPVRHLFALAFAPDGKLLASKEANRVIRLWDLSTGKELRPLQGPFDPSGAGEVVGGHTPGLASGLVFSADGKVLFSGSSKSLVRRWDVATGQELTSVGHTEGIQAAVVAPDGRTVTTQAADGLRQWDRVSGKEIQRLLLPQGAALATLSPDGRVLAFIVDHSVRLWDLATRREVRRWRLPGREFKTYHPSWLYQMCFSANGRVLAAKSYEGTIFLWASTGKEIETFSPETGRSRETAGHYNHESAFTLSPDGKMLARVEVISPWPLETLGDAPPSKRRPSTSVLRLYDVTGGRKLHEAQSPVAISAAVFSPDSRTLVTANRDYTLSLWEATTGRRRSTIKGSGGALAFAPNGRVLAVGDGPKVTLRSMPTGKLLCTFQRHSGDISALQFTSDGKALVSGSTDTTLLVWDVSKQTGTARLR
jgi:RNA polymerase sigma factor (sigma-70 family)